MVGLWPIFIFSGKMNRLDELTQQLTPTIEGMGYECVGIEMTTSNGARVLRIYIDRPHGVNVDDCQLVSKQISGWLDVEEPIKGNYYLEVSSPGINRPIFRLQDFARFMGDKAKIQLKQAIDGRKNFSCELRGVRNSMVVIQADGQEWEIPWALIRKANLSPELN